MGDQPGAMARDTMFFEYWRGARSVLNGRYQGRGGVRVMAVPSRWRAGLLAVLILLSGCGRESGGVTPQAGAQMPSVALTRLAGGESTSTDAFLGRPLVVNFWATWCQPCRDEMPSLERLSRRLASRGIQVIGVTVDNDRYLATEFVRSHGLTFPVYADGEKKQFQSSLRVVSLPETVLVTARGVIAARIVGARDWDSIESNRQLERALDEQHAARR